MNAVRTIVLDSGGLLNALANGEGNRTNYVYDPVGRLTSIWSPNSNNVAYI